MKTNAFNDFFNLLFPNLCIVCGVNLLKREKCICISCLYQIPKTNFHLVVDNSVEKKFWGKATIYRGTAFFFFQKGSSFQKTLHALKYKNNKEVGEVLGMYAGADLMDSTDFKSVDVIIPVPLHPKKYQKRGYNQSELIGKGLSSVMNIPQNTTTLIRVKENMTQTKKTVFERFENTDGIFQLSEITSLKGQHILLVDDVLTTGSTLEACIIALLQIEGVKVSVFTLAVA